MAKKAIEKYRAMSATELTKEEVALREEIWKLRLQMTTGQQQNPYRVRQVRRDLARLLTVRRQLEALGAAGTEKA